MRAFRRVLDGGAAGLWSVNIASLWWYCLKMLWCGNFMRISTIDRRQWYVVVVAAKRCTNHRMRRTASFIHKNGTSMQRTERHEKKSFSFGNGKKWKNPPESEDNRIYEKSERGKQTAAQYSSRVHRIFKEMSIRQTMCVCARAISTLESYKNNLIRFVAFCACRVLRSVCNQAAERGGHSENMKWAHEHCARGIFAGAMRAELGTRNKTICNEAPSVALSTLYFFHCLTFQHCSLAFVALVSCHLRKAMTSVRIISQHKP